MRFCFLSNRAESDIGLLDESLSGLGEYLFAYREDPFSWRNIDNVDLFVHLGSSWSVYWASVQTQVDSELSLMRHSIERGVPVLGICFGAQMLSHAFGGVVERGKKTEIGWHDVVAPETNSVLTGRWMQWHYDSFTAPRGFDVLAINEAGVQAIRRGRAFGVQFHPEANEPIVSKWMSGEGAAELAAAGIAPSSLLDETRRGVERTSVATTKLMDWFLEDVAQGPVAPSPGN
ncbi:MAG: aminotransferase [Actinobacteria bacterium]|nr:aminotransferase [Actinomycetota bacterium]